MSLPEGEALKRVGGSRISVLKALSVLLKTLVKRA
jgi:hypothetical protein